MCTTRNLVLTLAVAALSACGTAPDQSPPQAVDTVAIPADTAPASAPHDEAARDDIRLAGLSLLLTGFDSSTAQDYYATPLVESCLRKKGWDITLDPGPVPVVTQRDRAAAAAAGEPYRLNTGTSPLIYQTADYYVTLGDTDEKAQAQFSYDLQPSSEGQTDLVELGCLGEAYESTMSDYKLDGETIEKFGAVLIGPFVGPAFDAVEAEYSTCMGESGFARATLEGTQQRAADVGEAATALLVADDLCQREHVDPYTEQATQHALDVLIADGVLPEEARDEIMYAP